MMRIVVMRLRGEIMRLRRPDGKRGSPEDFLAVFRIGLC